MRKQKDIKADIIKAQKDVDTMHHIMSNCYSDEAYRNYDRTLRGFIETLNNLKKELENGKKSEF